MNARIAGAIAGLKARQTAVESVRGYFASDFRLNELATAAYGEQTGGAGGGQAAGLCGRVVCGGGFVAESPRLVLDGVVMGRGGLNPWGFVGPSAPGAGGVLSSNGSTSDGPAANDRAWRSWVVRDGERQILYSEGMQMQMVRRQSVVDEPQVAGRPLDELLFARVTGQWLGEFLGLAWSTFTGRGNGDANRWYYLDRRRVGDVWCEGIRKEYRAPAGLRNVPVPGQVVPRAETTVWFAPDMGFAPVRVEHISWDMAQGATGGIRAVLWTGTGFREADKGVWLPSKVRLERARVTGAGVYQWIQVFAVWFYGLQANQPIRPTEWTERRPPLGTTLSEEVELTPAWERSARASAWAATSQLVAQEPVLTPDTELAERLRVLSREVPNGGGAAEKP